MQRTLGALLASLAFGLAAPAWSVTPAAAQAAGGVACKLPDDQPRPGIRFFRGIQPSDGILDVWCRIQSLQGKYRVNVLFMETGAHRTFEATFNGVATRPREDMARFIQSLLPTTKDAPSQDEAGMPFPAVLAKTYQGLAPATPDGQGLGLPPAYPASKELVLWEPVVLRIRPLTIAEREFTLSILFRPQVGRFIMSLQGQAEQFTLKGAKGRVIPYLGDDKCPEARVPDCKGLPDVVDIHTAWQVEAVKLEADGGGLSGATQALFNALLAENAGYVNNNNMKRFSLTDGKAEIEALDPDRQIKAEAFGDPKRIAGTDAIKVVWRERATSVNSYATMRANWTKNAREQFVLRYVNTAKR